MAKSAIKLAPRAAATLALSTLNDALKQFDDASKALDALEDKKQTLLANPNLVISGRIPVSNNPEFNAHLETMEKAEDAVDQANANVKAAILSARPFIKETFEPIHKAKLEEAYAHALKYRLGHVGSAWERAHGATSVWPLRELITVAHDDNAGKDAARVICLHLEEFIAANPE